MTTIYGGSGKFRGRHGKRDTMRKRSYDAERDTPMWGVMQWGNRATVEQCQVFVNKALARAWVRKRFGRRHVTVTDSGGKGGACASYGTIYVSTYYRNHIVLLHELAHCLTPNDVGHGREWARTYVQLVASIMGAEAGKALRDAFRAHGVKTRRVTPAQRMAGRRLAAMAKERGNGTDHLAAYRAQRTADTAALLAAGWTRYGKKYWKLGQTIVQRATALDLLRGKPELAALVARAAARHVEQPEPEHVQTFTTSGTVHAAAAVDPYAPVWPEQWTPESRAEYLADHLPLHALRVVYDDVVVFDNTAHSTYSPE